MDFLFLLKIAEKNFVFRPPPRTPFVEALALSELNGFFWAQDPRFEFENNLPNAHIPWAASSNQFLAPELSWAETNLLPSLPSPHPMQLWLKRTTKLSMWVRACVYAAADDDGIESPGKVADNENVSEKKKRKNCDSLTNCISICVCIGIDVVRVCIEWNGMRPTVCKITYVCLCVQCECVCAVHDGKLACTIKRNHVK